MIHPMHCCKILLDRTLNVEEHPCHGVLPFQFDSEGMSVKILTCSMLDHGTGYSMIKIIDEKGVVEEGHYEKDGSECTITRISKSHYMAMVTNRRCKLSRLINKSGCFLQSAIPRTDTTIEWIIIGPNSNKIHELFADMRANGYVFETVSSEVLAVTSTLTPKQEQYFNTAMDLGYYDIPKRIGLDELCKVLGCSKSTLNVSLRTAEKNIFEFYRNICESNRFFR